MPRIPTMEQVANLSRDEWEVLCRGLAVELFQAEGVEDRLGKGNGMDMLRLDSDGVYGWQFRRFDGRLGDDQAQGIRESLELARQRAQSEDFRRLVKYEVWANIDLQPGHMGRTGERERIAKIREAARQGGVDVQFRGLTWIHTKLLAHPFIRPDLFENVSGQVAANTKQLHELSGDVSEILKLAQAQVVSAPAAVRLIEQARVHYTRGMEFGGREDFQKAAQSLLDARALITGLGLDSTLEARVLIALCGVKSVLGDLSTAVQFGAEAVKLLPEEEYELRAYALGNQAIALGYLERHAESEALHRSALRSFETLGLEIGIVQSLSHILESLVNTRQLEAARAVARRLHGAASALEKNTGGPSDVSLAAKGAVARLMLVFGIEFKDRRSLEDAVNLFSDLFVIAERGGMGLIAEPALSQKAEALRFLNRFKESIDVYRKLVSLALSKGHLKVGVDAKFNLAIVLHEDGRVEEAVRLMVEAERDYRTMGDFGSAVDAGASAAQWRAG